MDKQQIRDLFKTHDLTLSAKDVWDVKGKPVILHSALERLSAHLGLVWDLPTVVLNTPSEVVILARATRKDGIAEWSFGEVNTAQGDGQGGNYLIRGKQPGYKFAMAEKRAKDRVIIKLAGMHGAYSEEEAEEFSSRNQGNNGRQGGFEDERPASVAPEDEGHTEQPPPADPKPEPEAKPATRRAAAKKPEPKPEPEPEAKPEPTADGPANDDEPDDVKALRKSIKDCRTVNAVTDLMLNNDTQALLAKQPEALRNDLRDAAKARLVELGWPGKGGREAA